LNHCHLIGYGNGQEVGAAVGISNYFVDQINQVTNVGSINEGTITNSVIYGNLDNELAIDTLSDIAITLNFDFRNNLIRSTTVFTEPFYVDNIWNNEPLFYNIGDNDFHWYSTSPLDGGASFTFPTSSGLDIEGVVRSGPDIGAYEFL
jgi:hypothetical protein